MPGEGFTFDMISHLKRNNSYLSRRRYFDSKQEHTIASRMLRIKDPKKASPEQLKEIRLLYVARRKKQLKWRMFFMVVALVCTGLLIWGAIPLVRMVFDF